MNEASAEDTQRKIDRCPRRQSFEIQNLRAWQSLASDLARSHPQLTTTVGPNNGSLTLICPLYIC